VLICEDQELVRAGYVTVFGAQPDLEVVGEADDGPAAVNAATRLNPDVVIMDIQMPLLDGIEATRRIAVSRILTKLDLRDRVQSVVFAYRTGLTSAGD
jgi:DNA-binding NarL/FixJ family response regulator